MLHRVTKIRVNQLARAGRLAHEYSRDGWRLFRPAQVAVIGNARARFHPTRRGGLHGSAALCSRLMSEAHATRAGLITNASPDLPRQPRPAGVMPSLPL
jgi:hypothetical protein